jgi:hypothetical protein
MAALTARRSSICPSSPSRATSRCTRSISKFRRRADRAQPRHDARAGAARDAGDPGALPRPRQNPRGPRGTRACPRPHRHRAGMSSRRPGRSTASTRSSRRRWNTPTRPARRARSTASFKNYVKATTDKVAPEVDWLVSVFHDNAGIIKFDDDWLFALKAETHNSPSALDPYGGAMTGIVGVNRDILGAGMGCRCIFNTDVFCFASPSFDGEIPERLLHPRRVLRGVHRGVKDGGNESGIPTVNGAIVFHERFLGKPLVFCGTGGLIPVDRQRPAQPREGRAPRRPHRHVRRPHRQGRHPRRDLLLRRVARRIARDGRADRRPHYPEENARLPSRSARPRLYSCITDNGAGGLSSSIGEMARKPGGAEIHLDKRAAEVRGPRPLGNFPLRGAGAHDARRAAGKARRLPRAGQAPRGGVHRASASSPTPASSKLLLRRQAHRLAVDGIPARRRAAHAPARASWKPHPQRAGAHRKPISPPI